MPIPIKLPEEVDKAIERVRLSGEVQDWTGILKPVRFVGQPQREQKTRKVLALLQKRARNAPLKHSAINTLINSVLIKSLKVISQGKRGWRREKVRSIALPINGQIKSLDDVTGYVTASDNEDQVVRLALLLRLMHRRRDALDLLVKRIRSGLVSHQCQFWLHYLLTEAGEKRASKLLADTKESLQTNQVSTNTVRHRSKLRYGIVMLTMFDSEVFKSSLRSLAQSDFDGEILVVEDGYEADSVCRETCEHLKVKYLKQSQWHGSAAAMNDGIAHLESHTDIVMFAHNDILWPQRWFDWYDRAWQAAFSSQRLGLLNLGYVQFKRRQDPTLYELFLRGEYAHLRWILNATRDVSQLKDRVQNSQVRSGEQLFGTARDPWNDWTPDVRFMTGRFSVGASFPVESWRALGGFDPSMPYGFDLELQHYCLDNRKWILFGNNPPLIHLASNDTQAIDQDRLAKTTTLHQTYPQFEEKYGWQLEHFLNVYFSETAFIYQDEIIRAANALQFDKIDFVFDDFQRRLRERTLDNCELTWCRSRSNCAYVNPA